MYWKYHRNIVCKAGKNIHPVLIVVPKERARAGRDIYIYTPQPVTGGLTRIDELSSLKYISHNSAQMIYIQDPPATCHLHTHTARHAPYLHEFKVVGASGAPTHFMGGDSSSASSESYLPLCSDLELASLGHVLDSFEGFVFLTIHVQPVDLQS